LLKLIKKLCYCRLVKMIPISVYFGGDITQNVRIGVEYTIGPRLTLSGSENITLEEIKNVIYRGLGVEESQYSIDIQCRINTAPIGYFFFNVMYVYDESSWRIAYEAAYSKMGMVELYVKLNPIETGWNDHMYVSSHFDGCNVISSTSQQACVVSNRVKKNQPVSTDENLNQQEITNLEPIPTDNDELNDDEDYNVESDENTDSADDEAGEDDEILEADEEIDIGPNVNRRGSYNPFIGRGWVHPASSFHDSSQWVPADYPLIGTDVSIDGLIAEKQSFQSKEHLNHAVSKWHIDNNKEFKVRESGRKKLRYVCRDENCSWYLYATPTGAGDAWGIRKCPYKHICRATAARVDHAQLTAKMIADIIREDVQNNTSLPIKHIRGLVRKVYPGVNPTYNKLWRAREIAIAYLFGSWSGSYALLPQLLNAIILSNPGSKAVVYSNPLPCAGVRQFSRAAWAFAPCIQALPYLRPVISIDASFLKGRYKGRLFVAVGYDAENQLMPLAFGLAEVENIENWGWFMRWLRREIVGNNKKICVISDRHAAIKHIFQNPSFDWHEEADEAVHRLCAQHLAENLLKKCSNKYAVDAFKKACRENSPWNLKNSLDKVIYWSEEAAKYIKGIGKRNENDEKELEVPCKWSLCYDEGHRWGIMTSNAAESLNNVFREARGLPVCAIVEATYYKLLEWFNKRKQHARVLAQNGQIFSERVTKILEKNAEDAKQLEVQVIDLDHGVFEVISKHERVTKHGARQDRSYKVILTENHPPKCKCREPQNLFIACKHILAVCAVRNYNPNIYTHQFYSVHALLRTWEGHFEIFGKEEDWPTYDGDRIIPDRKLVQKGRRKSKRMPMTMDVMEGRMGPQHCHGCGSINHTDARCNRTNMEAGIIF